MTKDKKFQMRCDQHFLDTLDQISEGMGLTRSSTIDVLVNFYPGLIELQAKLDKLIKDAKDSL